MYKLPELSYQYTDLEPFIDEMTMQIHHTKHHQAYINNLNDCLKDEKALLNMDIRKLIMNLASVPQPIRNKVRNNGGGHINHSLFWTMMSPNKDQMPTGKLLTQINSTFGSIDELKKIFNEAGLNRFGSGWVWLVINSGKLSVISTLNQDNPLMDHLGEPLLGLDVWEHAYYLKYQNRRAEYIDAWWHIVNWDQVATLYSNIQ